MNDKTPEPMRLIDNSSAYFYNDPRESKTEEELHCSNCGKYHAGTGYCRVCKFMDPRENLVTRTSEA